MNWLVVGLAAWMLVAVLASFAVGAAIRTAERRDQARRRPSGDGDLLATDRPAPGPRSPEGGHGSRTG
jgi:hypothetical protein